MTNIETEEEAKEFEILEKALEDLSIKLKNYANDKIKFTVGEKFELEKYHISLLKVPKKVKGVYFLEILNENRSLDFKEWMEDFRKKWDNASIKNRPALVDKRIEKHSGIKDWIPFYMGKAENIQFRVDQHITLRAESSTYALKLGAMENLKKETFRLSYVAIDTKHYDVIMHKIEQLLRDKYHPIIGKQ